MFWAGCAVGVVVSPVVWGLIKVAWMLASGHIKKQREGQ
jgi:hypothetical protein